MICERCRRSTTGLRLHDYCRKCSKNLCDSCMAHGCCGTVPALSGMDEDDGEPDAARPAVEWPAELADVRAEIEASLARVGATVVRAEVRAFRPGVVSYFVEWVEPGGATEDWYERSPEELAFEVAGQCAARGSK